MMWVTNHTDIYICGNCRSGFYYICTYKKKFVFCNISVRNYKRVLKMKTKCLHIPLSCTVNRKSLPRKMHVPW